MEEKRSTIKSKQSARNAYLKNPLMHPLLQSKSASSTHFLGKSTNSRTAQQALKSVLQISGHTSNTSNNMTTGLYSSTGGNSFLQKKQLENLLSQKASTVVKTTTVNVPGKFMKNPSLKLLQAENIPKTRTRLLYKSP